MGLIQMCDNRQHRTRLRPAGGPERGVADYWGATLDVLRPASHLNGSPPTEAPPILHASRTRGLTVTPVPVPNLKLTRASLRHPIEALGRVGAHLR